MDTDDADSDIDDSEGDEPEALCVLVARETSTAFAEQSDDVKVVQTEFDYKDMVAYQFMSDGSKRLAISYENGADHFLVAIFASGPWPTEVPNAWYDQVSGTIKKPMPINYSAAANAATNARSAKKVKGKGKGSGKKEKKRSGKKQKKSKPIVKPEGKAKKKWKKKKTKVQVF